MPPHNDQDQPPAGFRSVTQLDPERNKNENYLVNRLDQAVGCSELLARLLQQDFTQSIP